MNSCQPENFACVVVDMVNGFVKAGAMADPAIMGITPAIVRVLEHTDESRRVFFADTHEKDCIEFAAFPPHCVKGTEESEIIDELKPYVTAGIIPKNSTNGFHAMKDLSVFSGVDSVVVTGCCTDICVLQFALTLKTWFNENGLEFFGSFGKGYASFDYQAMIVAGLNANGFDRNTWIASGKQGIFEEDNFTSPGYVARLDYKGVPGLRIGASFYYCADAGSNSDKADTYSSTGKIPVRIYTADAQYRNKYVVARANMVYGNLGNSAKLSEANTKLSNKSPYSRITPIAKNVVSYAAEAGLNISAFFKGNRKVPVIYPFARYEYYNPQEKGEASQIMEKRCQVSMWTAGLNWYALPNLVVKADYTTRQIGTNKVFGTGKYNSENEFSIGIAYIGWFVTK